MRSTFETIAVEQRDNCILLITLNRPEAANALNTQMGLDLMELFEGLAIDVEGLRTVILTGRGTKAFCAGGDLKQRNGMTTRRGRRNTSSLSVCCGPLWGARSP
jgi:enoyl-CoA hydratase